MDALSRVDLARRRALDSRDVITRSFWICPRRGACRHASCVMNPSGARCGRCALEPGWLSRAGEAGGFQGEGPKVTWVWFSDR